MVGRILGVRFEHSCHIASENARHLRFEPFGQGLEQGAGTAPARIHIRSFDITAYVFFGVVLEEHIVRFAELHVRQDDLFPNRRQRSQFYIHESI